MAFCSKCGAEIDEGAKFCPKCGEATGSNKAGGSAKNENGKGNENEFEKIINTPDTTESFDRDDIAKNKGMSVLSYIWILFIIPLFAAKDSKFARFHANQGLVLFIVDTCVAVCARLARSIFAGIPILGIVISIVFSLASVACFALVIIGIINAVQGKAKELPLIGSIKIVK